MKKWLLIAMSCLVVLGVQAGPLTNAPACIELPDQFEKPQKLSFPNTNLTVLTIADRKGSEQIAGWVEPVAQRFGTRVAVRGIADVSAVPRLLRGTVRSAFRKEQSYPVMLDWSGKEVAKFAPKENVTTVLLIDGQGKILRRYEGVAKKVEVEELCKLIQEMLPKQEIKVAAKP
jgi:hypothetical protein